MMVLNLRLDNTVPTWASVLALPLTSWVTLGKSSNPSVPRVWNGELSHLPLMVVKSNALVHVNVITKPSTQSSLSKCLWLLCISVLVAHVHHFATP